MLRIIAIALLLANVLLLGLQMSRQPAPALAEAPATAVSDAGAKPGLPTIVLLSELPGATGLAEGTAECFSAGPFHSAAQRDAALDLISGSAHAIGRRQSEATVEAGRWVYLPSQPDIDTARNMALTMRDAGLGEVEVIPDGDWGNSVSLGFYTNPSFARERQERARALGFQVEVRVQEKAEPRYWLDYEQKLGAPFVRPSPDAAVTPGLLRAISCGDWAAGPPAADES